MPRRHTFLFNLHCCEAPGGTNGVLVLAVDTTVPTDRDAEDTLEAFKRALTAWVNTSEDGRAAWDKYDSFNIGDLANLGGVSSTLMAAMSAEQICSFNIKGIDFDISVDHDDSLVTRTDVKPRDD